MIGLWRRLWWTPLGALVAHFVFNNSSHLRHTVFDYLGHYGAHWTLRTLQAAIFLAVARSIGLVLDDHPRAASAPDAMFPSISFFGAVALVISIFLLDSQPWRWAASEAAFAVVGIGAGPHLVRYIGFEQWSDRLFQSLLVSATLGILIVFDVESIYWISVKFFRYLYIACFFAIGSTNFAWYFLGEGTGGEA